MAHDGVDWFGKKLEEKRLAKIDAIQDCAIGSNSIIKSMLIKISEVEKKVSTENDSKIKMLEDRIEMLECKIEKFQSYSNGNSAGDEKDEKCKATETKPLECPSNGIEIHNTSIDFLAEWIRCLEKKIRQFEKNVHVSCTGAVDGVDASLVNLIRGLESNIQRMTSEMEKVTVLSSSRDDEMRNRFANFEKTTQLQIYSIKESARNVESKVDELQIESLNSNFTKDMEEVVAKMLDRHEYCMKEYLGIELMNSKTSFADDIRKFFGNRSNKIEAKISALNDLVAKDDETCICLKKELEKTIQREMKAIKDGIPGVSGFIAKANVVLTFFSSLSLLFVLSGLPAPYILFLLVSNIVIIGMCCN